MKFHTLLGANGNIAKVISQELGQKGLPVRQVSRNPKKVNPADDLVSADLKDPLQVKNAVRDSSIVYLVAGITYKTAIWQTDWPIIMRNTLDGCMAHGAKLVFFDNMYALDPTQVGNLTEETPLIPVSKKGLVRKQILEMLWAEVNSGNISAMVVRAGDFYGPGANNSFLNELVIERMKAGKNPQWLYDGTKRHSFTYIPDAGKVTVVLALQDSAWNQTWNLPTDPSYPSGLEITQVLNELLSKKAKLQVMPDLMVLILGLFISPLKEIRELKYQSAEDYRLDSSKLEKSFGIKPTPFREGLLACLK